MIGHKKLESYINSRGINEIVANLEGTPYEQDIQKAVGKEIEVDKLEVALDHHFLRILREVTKHIPEDDRVALDHVFMREWDLKNLKSVVRAVVYGASVEEVKELFDGYGDISEAELMELAQSKDLEELSEKLGERPFSSAMKSAVEAYKNDGRLSLVEAALDLEYLNGLDELEHETDSKDLKQYLRMQNESLVLRNLKRSDAVSEFLKKLRKYHLSDKQVNRLLAGEDVEKVLATTPYAKMFKGGKNADIAVENTIIQSLKDLTRTDPLGLASIILFIKEKQIELRNLRVVIIGKSNDLEPDVIRSMLI